MDLSGEGNRCGIQKIVENLRKDLERHGIEDEAALLKRIDDSESIVQKYRDEGSEGELKEEMAILLEMKDLKELLDNINAWNEGLEKYELDDVDELSDKIEEMENRIEKLKKQGKVEKANKEKVVLQELQELQKLHERILDLQSVASLSIINPASELDRLQRRLCESLKKHELDDASELFDKIEEIEKRIEKLEKQGKTEKANKEKVTLRQLQELQKLHERTIYLESVASASFTDSRSEQDYLERRLREVMEKRHLKIVAELTSKVEEMVIRIGGLHNQGNIEKENEAKVVLQESQELQSLDSKMNGAKEHSAIFEKTANSNEQSCTTSSIIGSMIVYRTSEKQLHCEELRDDCAAMPVCAERTTMELLLHFRETHKTGFQEIDKKDSAIQLLEKVKEQAKRQELLSEEVRASLQGLESMIQNKTDDSTVQVLERILKKMRPLNVHDVRRLVGKAQKAAELIRNKDVVLLIGATGAGKSTTIQFLAGATMTETRVEVAPGRFLEHITAIDVGENPDLKYITSSPLNKSETRYIAPVTVPLNKVIGHHATGDIILCDAPGFGDTAGPEVDIANSVAVVKALKGCKSVKLFALSSYKGLGDRGQGIQKLAHLLVNMVVGIEERLDSIFYGFTKYPEKMDINALLLDVKTSKVDKDPALRADKAFVTVLSDMIERTEDGAHKIDPIKGDRKLLVKSLSRIPGIGYPEEAFRFSLSEETLAVIVDQAKVDKLNIICALKNKDIDLVQYYQ